MQGSKGKLILILVLCVLLLIVIIQNMEAVSTKILFVTVTMPRAALLFMAMVVGFILGLIVALIRPGVSKNA
jgi:uncharacterized integral membrane protein